MLSRLLHLDRHGRLSCLALVLSACGLLGDAGDGETEATGVAGSDATGVPTTGSTAGCYLDPADCPASEPCEQVDCVDQQCVYTPIVADERDDDVPGDCRGLICDGAGAGAPVDDATDLPDDDNSCTLDLCSPAGPENLPQAPGSACADGGVCHADRTCQPCPERATCLDDSPAEPNETQGTADPRPQRSDTDGPAYACEALGGPGDVDWFTLDTLDLAFGKVAPAVSITPDDLQVCIYFQCKQGGTTVQCPEGSVAANAPIGQLGCCGPGGLAPQIDCKGFNEDATLWLTVRRDPGAAGEPVACLNYQLAYEY